MLLVQTTGQVDTGGDVTPLVGAADLQLDAMHTVQAGEVVALQQVIGEFGEGDADIVAIQALLNRFLVNHLVNGEVLTDVAQEGQHIHAAKPVVVIGGDGAVSPTIEIQERCDLVADLLDPTLYRLFRIQLTLARLETRVADQPCRPADQRHRLMPGQLEALQTQQGNQMAQMQAVCGRIESAIQCDRPLRQSLCQRLFVRNLGHEAPLLQLFNQVAACH